MTAQEAVAFLASKKRTLELLAAVFASLRNSFLGAGR
jgi:hypothetical protein